MSTRLLSSRRFRRLGSKNLMPGVKRSLTIDEPIHAAINKARAKFLDSNIDIDYTRAANMLLALGARRFSEAPWDDKTTETVLTYLKSEELKMEALSDEIDSEVVNQFPKVIQHFLRKYAQEIR